MLLRGLPRPRLLSAIARSSSTSTGITWAGTLSTYERRCGRSSVASPLVFNIPTNPMRREGLDVRWSTLAPGEVNR